MQAVGYIRVSTQGQADDGASLEAQKARIRAWCLANEYELVALFEDRGISGKTTNRPAFTKALDTVGQDIALVAYSLSRLTRSTKDMLHIAETLEKRGADLVSLTEKIDTTTAAGRMVFRMLAVLNEFEADLVSERTKAALAHKKSQGQRVGTIPFGYRLAEDDTTLKAEPTEQAILGKIQELRNAGFSLRAIANQLNADGVLTRRGSAWKFQYIDNLLKAA